MMRERAETAGVRLSIKSKPGHGTQVDIQWPDTHGKELP
jgi:signal transduction histidine kinase